MGVDSRVGGRSSVVVTPRTLRWMDEARWDDALLELPRMPAHGCVASGANAVSPPTAGFNLSPATCKVIHHVVDTWANLVDVDFSLEVARNAPPTGGVVHSYTWSARVEFKVGDRGRRCSNRGLLGWRETQLSFG